MARTISPILGQLSPGQLAPIITDGRIRPQLVEERNHENLPLPDTNGI